MRFIAYLKLAISVCIVLRYVFSVNPTLKGMSPYEALNLKIVTKYSFWHKLTTKK